MSTLQIMCTSWRSSDGDSTLCYLGAASSLSPVTVIVVVAVIVAMDGIATTKNPSPSSFHVTPFFAVFLVLWGW